MITEETTNAGPRDAAQPEYGRVEEVERRFGIRRSMVYELIKKREILSVAVGENRKKAGIRLVDLESVRAYIRRQAEKNQKEAQR